MAVFNRSWILLSLLWIAITMNIRAVAQSSTKVPTEASQGVDPTSGPTGASWSILDLDASSRASVCDQQQVFCNNQCGGSTATLTNFCNQTSMAWGCSCRNDIPDCPPYQWPVTVAECTGQLQTCQSACTDGPTVNECLKNCDRFFRCNQPGSPQSFLRTETPQQTPTYTGQASHSNHVAVSRSVWIGVFLQALIHVYLNHKP